MIVDCSDNAETRYLLGDCAHHQGRTLVFGAAARLMLRLGVCDANLLALGAGGFVELLVLVVILARVHDNEHVRIGGILSLIVEDLYEFGV